MTISKSLIVCTTLKVPKLNYPTLVCLHGCFLVAEIIGHCSLKDQLIVSTGKTLQEAWSLLLSEKSCERIMCKKFSHIYFGILH